MDAAHFMPNEAVLAGIRKDIENYEASRASAARQVRWRVPVFVGAVVLAVLPIAWLFNAVANPYEQWLSTPHLLLYICGFVAAVGAYLAAVRPARSARGALRDRLLPIIFGFVEDVRFDYGRTPDSFDRLPRQTVGSFNRTSFDDVMSGRYGGFSFELYETRLEEKSGPTTTTAFRGVIVAFDAAAPFAGVLVATREAAPVTGFFRGIFGAGLENVASGVPKLDAVYEFRTDNPPAARPLVTGRLAKALEWLNESWPSGPVRVALSGRDGFLLLPESRNFFELPSISTPLDYRTHIEPMIADIATILATAALVRKVNASDGDPPTPA